METERFRESGAAAAGCSEVRPSGTRRGRSGAVPAPWLGFGMGMAAAESAGPALGGVGPGRGLFRSAPHWGGLAWDMEGR